MFFVIPMVAGFMTYHRRDLPLIILPVTIYLLGVESLAFEGRREKVMVQINLPDVAVMTIIGGVIVAVIGGETTAVGALWKIWKDSKAIEDIKKLLIN